MKKTKLWSLNGFVQNNDVGNDEKRSKNNDLLQRKQRKKENKNEKMTVFDK